MSWTNFNDSDTIPNGSKIRVLYQYEPPVEDPEKCGDATAHIDPTTGELTFTCDDLGTCQTECQSLRVDNGDGTFTVFCDCNG
jgi:hypothetical protein